MKRAFACLLTVSLCLLLKACDTTDPPDTKSLTLKLEDVSCTEAWITLTTTNLQLPTTVTIKQNNQTQSTINLVKPDTLLYIDSLLPNTTYKYQVSCVLNPVSSNSLSVTTLDTTSHNFTFETFTFGGTAGSSTLYDVAVINENNIWAVGEIYVADTSQNGYTLYNAVHWDGNEWELKRIKTNACGGVEYPPIKAIFSFAADDILFAHIDGSITHYNGREFINDCSLITQLNGSANKIWGISKDDYYVVSGNGFIAHYNGQSWTRIESGTELNIGDIWGIADRKGGYNKYLAAVDAMLKIDANNNLSRIDAEPGHSLGSVWCMINMLIYTSGGYGLSLYKNYYWEKIDEPVTSTIRVVRGQNHNDVYGLGMPGIIIHFNGYSWQTIVTGQNNIHYRIEVKNDFAATVGWQGDKALITVIKRTQ